MILSITLNPAIDRVYFLDSLEVGEVNRPQKMTYTAGGKGLNVARVLTILGERVSAGGFLGGYNGKFIRAQVTSAGMVDRFVEIGGETRICINMTERSSGQSTEILEPGPTISEEEREQFLRQYREDLQECSLVTVSGSMPKGIPTDFYATLIELAHQAGKKILVDTSGESLKHAIAAKPYAIKPNRYELSKLYDRQTDTIAQIKEAVLSLQSAGIQMPCISLGKDGAVAGLSNGVYQFTTPDIPVVNTVGSGDSFIAGIALGLSRGMDEKDTVKMGMACATANTQFEQTGMVTQKLVEQYFKQIQFTKI